MDLKDDVDMKDLRDDTSSTQPEPAAPDTSPKNQIPEPENLKNEYARVPTLPHAVEALRDPSGSPDKVIHKKWIRGVEVQKLLGAGGVATVHQGMQLHLKRLVAVKSLRVEYLNDFEVVARFEREAESLAHLSHRNIVQVYDLVVEPDNTRHIIMELVEGIDAFDLLQRAGPLPAHIVALIILQIAEALDHAHFHGLVHRDIKPSNVGLTWDGVTKLMDFGIARDQSTASITQTGWSIGTPSYMAPEQIRGESIDGRSDLFAVGILMYELLAGVQPWPGLDSTAALKVLKEPHPPISTHRPGIPKSFCAIVDRCLEKQPYQRWPNAAALRTALDEWLQYQASATTLRSFLSKYRQDGASRSALEPHPSQQKMPSLKDLEVERTMNAVTIVHALGLFVIAIAIIFSVTHPIGQQLPETRPVLQLSTDP